MTTVTMTKPRNSERTKPALAAKERKKIKVICNEYLMPLGRRRRQLIKRQQLINQPATSEFVSRLCSYPEYEELSGKKEGVKQVFAEAKKVRDAVLKLVGTQEFTPIYAAICAASKHADRREALDAFKSLLSQSLKAPQLEAKSNGKKRKKRFEYTSTHIEVAAELCSSVMADRMSLMVFNEEKSRIDEEMQTLVQELHVYEWWESVRGVGAQGLASLIGETGDLFNYSNPAKVWKRLGLAPYSKKNKNGELVTKAPSTWRRQAKGSGKGLEKDDWVELGYSPQRRSIIFAAIGQCLVKQQSPEDRSIYLGKKEEIAAREPDWTKSHIDMYAIRYMEKRLVRQLWRHWWATK